MALPYVINYLVDSLSLVRGTDIFEALLPEGRTEGIQVNAPIETSTDTGFETDVIVITIFYLNYITAKATARSIFDSLKVMRGLTISQYPFTLQGEITKGFLGQDDQRRFIFEIRLVVKHSEGSSTTTTTTTSTTTTTTSTTTSTTTTI
jgi:hypothetical protein